MPKRGSVSGKARSQVSVRPPYLSMRYTDRLADVGIEPSVGSRGDSYDITLAESVIALFKTEVIQRKRLLEPIGHVPPAEYEAQYYESTSVA